MKVLTHELQPRFLWGQTAEDIVLMLSLGVTPAATYAEYMANCNALLRVQGRATVNTQTAQTFLEGLQAHGIVQIQEED